MEDLDLNNKGRESAGQPSLRGYKTVCAKLGLVMCIYFICRLTVGPVSGLILRSVNDSNAVILGTLYYILLILLTYVIPIAAACALFMYKPPVRDLYKKPRRVARALGTFPAACGLGYSVALLTLLVSHILSNTIGESYIQQLLRPTTIEATSNIADIILMVFLLVIAAPLFEEYFVRGVMFDALRPYGAGVAIVISSVLFGFMHGSLYMLFYTTALGLALGYIRYATGSLFAVTILHALINAVSAGMLLLDSLVGITGGTNKVLNTVNMIYIVAVLLLVIVGIIIFISKIPAIRKYKYENPWNTVSSAKKIGVFIISAPVLIMLVFVFNEISGQFLLNLLIG